jgi:hypothetical protein
MAEGRVLCLLLPLYAFDVCSAATAMLETFLIGYDAEDEAMVAAGATAVQALHVGIVAPQAELRVLRSRQSAELRGARPIRPR